MKKKYCLLLSFCLIFSATTFAQVYIGGGFGGGYGRFGGGYGVRRGRPQRRPQQMQPPFQPTVNVSVGYGFPNLDATQFPDYYGLYKGTITQTGPVTAAVDYRFSRTTSIGVLGTYGKVSVPYYDYNSPSGLVQTGSLENWSVMLNLMQYAPLTQNSTLYFRAALGANIWNTSLTDGSGNKIAPLFTPSPLAYQLGIGAKVNITEDVAFFAEAGYGKYIVHGGLSFSFR